MKLKRLFAMFLAFTLAVTSSGMGVFAATDLDDMPDLEFEEGVEDWDDCVINGHTEVKDKAVAATCTKKGKTEGVHCSLCQTVFVKQETIPALGHSLVKDIEVKATLKADGKTAGSHCSRCKVAVDAQKVIPKIASVKLSYTKKAYTGKKLDAPKLTIKDSKGKVLVKDTDYTVKGLVKKKAVGRYKVTVTFKGNYEGSKTLYFTIVPKKVASAKASLSRAAGATKGYDDIKFSWKKSVGAKGYLVYYKAAGASKYTFLKSTTKLSVTKKNLKAGKKYTFKVVPYYKTSSSKTKYYLSGQSKTASTYTLKKVTDVKVTKNGAKVKVKWKNINGATGYQISKSEKKNKVGKITTYKKAKGTYKNISATKGKTYYYKVRAYKVVDGKKIFGPWSAVKTFKRK